ncbi:MAG TPA: TetR/AcrR family transcriptional regulator [Humibacter sp.]|nr:TetR/AcrR family transcriptional regulator [Humibacter sp.]
MPTIIETPTETPAPTRARAPRRDAAENRAALVEAAISVLNRDIDGSLETIAAEAGLTRRAVYGHFATRDDLVREVLTQGAARIGASILTIEHADARIEIALYGATLWLQVQHASVTAEFAVRGPHMRLVAEALEPARAKLRATVRRGVHDGVLRRDIAPDRLARLIEGVALDVLAEATHEGLDDRAGHTLVMVAALSVAGLGWREADDLVAGTPELAYRVVSASGTASVNDDGGTDAGRADAGAAHDTTTGEPTR